jgi:hypothetical protein
MGNEDEVLSRLEAADWDDIIIKLTHYTQWFALRYKRKTGSPDQLASGLTAKDIALNAIVKVWDKTRKWDTEKYPDLLAHLKWIVGSDIDHLFNSMEHRTTHRIMESEDGDGSELTYNNISPDPSSPLSRSLITQTPEEQLLAKEKDKHEEIVKQKLYETIKGDEDLELLFMCFEDGLDKPELIAKEMGCDVTKVYTLKRKLSRKATIINKIVQQG